MRIKLFSCLFIVVLHLMGCVDVYTIKKNVPVSVTADVQKKGDITGITKIYVGNIDSQSYGSPLSFSLYKSDIDLFIMTEAKHQSNAKYLGIYIQGVTNKFGASCNYHDGKCSVEELAKKYNLVKVDGSHNFDYNRTKLISDYKYITFYSKYDKKDVLIEWIDSTNEYMEWKSRYEKIRETEKINDYFEYIKEYPTTPHAVSVLNDMFNRFFDFTIASKHESKQRPIKRGGLVSSSAGSCKDIEREIRIKPKTDQRPPRDITVNVKYTLRRTYKPYALEEKDDPLYRNGSFRLTVSNGFTATDKVNFECVLTSGRFHHVGLSLLGALVGKKSAESGINTTLESLGFDADVVSIK